MRAVRTWNSYGRRKCWSGDATVGWDPPKYRESPNNFWPLRVASPPPPQQPRRTERVRSAMRVEWEARVGWKVSLGAVWDTPASLLPWVGLGQSPATCPVLGLVATSACRRE